MEFEMARDTKILNGHGNSVNCITKLNNIEIASGSSDQSIKIWNIPSGNCLKTINKHFHTERVYSLENFNKNQLYSFCEKGFIKLWDLTTGMLIKSNDVSKFLGNNYSSGSINLMLNYTDVATNYNDSSDCKLYIWDLLSCFLKKTLCGHNALINQIIRLNKSKLISASVDYEMRLCNYNKGQCLKTIKATLNRDFLIKGRIICIEFLNKRQLVTYSSEGNINIWDLNKI